MDQFLLIVPEGWAELPNAQDFVDQHGEAQLVDILQSNQLGSFDGLLGDAGYVPEGQTLEDVRMFRDMNGYRIWFKLKAL